MKKSLITQFAMTMLMAFTASFTLTSCGEEVVIDPPIEGKTVFSAGSISFNNEDGTRTSLDKNLVYYWQFNDQIWVNDNGTWLKSSDSELSPDSRSARFYYNKLMAADSYEVVYTGLNSNSATEVTIPVSFTAYNNSVINIGERGDCGVATATKQDGIYQFALEHKGSYLGIAPLKTGYLNKNYRWTKIEITDVNGKPIAGTFGFSHANGIDSTSVTSPSSTITLTGADGYDLKLQSYNSEYDYIFTVIPPCHRQLHVKYSFVDMAEPENVMTITKRLNPRKFFENNVVTFRHGLSPEYYRWDAPKSEPCEPERVNHNEGADFVQATNSCATMPNPNELYWYIVNGDPRWDATSEDSKWTDDGGASYHKGGVWLKKKSVILAEGKTFNSNIGKDGVDMRTTHKEHRLNSATYTSGGRPADADISKYFFLPALGNFSNAQIIDRGIEGYYWSSNAGPTSAQGFKSAYRLRFSANEISVYGHATIRSLGLIAGKGSDWFK